MLIVEIASYPKSGNTWFRHLTVEFLRNVNASNIVLPLERASKNDLDNKENWTCIGDKQYCFYKSHITNKPSIKPDFIVYIYRHPLDVFLSALNYIYHKSDVLPQNRLDEIFIDGSPKSVDMISASGELD